MNKLKPTKKSSKVASASLLKKKKRKKGEAGSGTVFAFAIVGLAIVLGGATIGRVTPNLDPLEKPPFNPETYECCDTGSGSACQLRSDKQITFNGQNYSLLKSNIFQGESGHIAPTDTYTPEGRRIFTNISDVKNGTKYSNYPGCEPGKDLIGMKDNPKAAGVPCFGVPNDQMIYVCKDTNQECSKLINLDTVPFDVYFRTADGAIPEEISTYCPKPKLSTEKSTQRVVALPSNGEHKNLQLETFYIEEDLPKNEWLGAWCKPAVYLYPEKTTAVNVQVEPQGPFTLTIPQYPWGGWDVTAMPDGTVIHEGKTFPYLYWEASLPDELIKEPTKGYVVAPKDMEKLFDTVLPQLGLNAKESKEFKEYWLKALPESPYYFVGVMPQNEVNELAPLNIEPKPDSVLRVTLYFKALDKKEYVQPPVLSGFTRKGFTVTEWGGLFKADKAHKDFTCVM